MVEDREVSEFDHAIAETALRYSGALGVGPVSDSVEIDRDHDICVAYCTAPGQRRRGTRCPSCYGRVAVRDIYGNEIEPAGTRFAWLAGSFLGGWSAAWRDATVGMVRDGTARRHPDRGRGNTHDHDPEGVTG